jgi:hypothetical protein
MDASPIDGVAIVIEGETDLVLLTARLSGQDRDLAQFIVKQVESDEASSAAN